MSPITTQQPSMVAKEPIAIIGSACRFPGGASSPSKLWDLLQEPIDLRSEIPASRFNVDGFYHPEGSHHGTSNVRHSYLLQEDCREFDAQFFGIKPIEANAIDPQQRLLLETTYESIEAAGIKLEKLRGSDTAVYIGLMCGDYADLQLRDPEALPTYTATGTARSIMSNRISYFFDLHGESATIDTACSSSLVAVHHAVQTLRSGTSRVAIAGGSNLCLGPEPYIGESKLSMLSPNGRSRMWDAAADGYARGDGVASIVLKTLSSALEDGDHIESIIRETGVNQDGRTPGITMPSASAQTMLIRETYARAGLDLSRREDRPQLFEAHGTGTPTGDPLEAEAISSAFFPPSQLGHEKLFVGSIKTVIGHTEGTAGLAGLLKASLAVQAGIIPPNLHFDKLSSRVAPFYQHLKIVSGRAIPWPRLLADGPRRASVNSFGFGGSNAHAIIESYQEPSGANIKPSASNSLPIIISATSERSLVNTLGAYSEYLAVNPEVDVRSLAWSLNFRRTRFPLQVFLPATDSRSLGAKVQQKLEDVKSSKANAYHAVSKQAKSSRKPLLGVFTGQGAQYSSMMKELVKTSVAVQRRLRSLDLRLAKLPKAERPSWSILDELRTGSSRIKEAALSQPLCTAVQIVLVDLLRAAEVKLDAVVGHSSGEIGAAYAVGFISAEDAIVISYYRGFCSRLASGNSGSEGGMVAIGVDGQDALELIALPELQGRIGIAAYNSASSFTLSGDRDAVELAKDIMSDEGKFARLLQVDKAYHSHHMQKCSEAYLSAMAQSRIGVQTAMESSGSIWYSSVSDTVMTAERQDLAGQYWDDNMLQPVLFAQAVECATAVHGPFAMALEIGPHAALKGPVTQIMSDLRLPDIQYSGLLDRKMNANEAIAESLGRVLALLGPNAANMPKLDAFMTEAPPPPLLKGLPAYGWNHDRSYWQESRSSRVYRSRGAIHPLLGARLPDDIDQEYRWRNFLSPKELPWLNGHMIEGQMIFPASGYISASVEAAVAISRGQEVRFMEVTDLVLGQALVFEENGSSVETLFSVTNVQHDASIPSVEASFIFASAVGRTSEALSANASGRFKVIYGPATESLMPRYFSQQAEMVDISTERFYGALTDIGYGYTGPFRALKNLKRKLMTSEGIVETLMTTEDRAHMRVDPAMLDATIQSIMLAKSYPGDGRLSALHVPQRIERVSINLSLCTLDQKESCFVTSVADHEESGIIGDVTILNTTSSHATIMMEGILAVPLGAATVEDDKAIFSEMSWDFALPNGQAVAFDGKATLDDYQLAMVLERVSHYYLKQFNDEFGDDHPARHNGPHVGLLRYARHVRTNVAAGDHKYSDRDWAKDTCEMVQAESLRFPHNIDLEIMHVIGKHMPSVIRGEANILEFVREDRLLDRYYESAMGISYYTHYLARLVNTIVHRHPHMNILEIGAGTGGATKHVLREIEGTFNSYTFSDISSGFFPNAKQLFQKHENKMSFKVLDLEKDVLVQGYVPESYDLVIASFVLHATSNIHETLENVRTLLKPGGYLVMLEVTNLEQSRLGYIFGAFDGWWLGADDGRVLSPCLPKQAWHKLLTDTGFSGIDTSTPDQDELPFPASAIVTQAVDNRVHFLRSPLTASYDSIKSLRAIKDLLIIGGTTQEVADTIASLRILLGDHVETFIHCLRLHELPTTDLSSNAMSLVLEDLDEPIFKEMSAGSLNGLRLLYAHSRAVLWITNRSTQGNPHHNQSLGFGRSMQVEMAHVESQFLDIDSDSPGPAVEVIAEALLRFVLGAELARQEHLLWTTESELAWSGGQLCIPRVKPIKEANARYNAQRRPVFRDVDLGNTTVEVVRTKKSYSLREVARRKTTPTHFINIKVQLSISDPVTLDDGNRMYLVAGTLANTSYSALALSDRNASEVIVPKNWVTLCSKPITPQLMKQMFLQFQARNLVFGLEKGLSLATLDVHADLLLALYTEATLNGLQLVAVSDSVKYDQLPPQLQILSLNGYSIKQALQVQIPKNLSACIYASNLSGSAQRIIQCLPQSCKVQRPVDSPFHTVQFSETVEDTWYTDSLQEVLDIATTALVKLPPSVTATLAVPFAPLLHQNVSKTDSRVLEWASASHCEVQVETIHATTKFTPGRTYWLVGLTGSLGISLCRWMVQHGARTVVFTSRNPKIDEAFITEMEAAGATVKAIQADITSWESISIAHAQIASTLDPIAGVVHGAMVLDDAMLEDMTIAQFESTLAPKVKGSMHLDRLFPQDSLEFFIMFSSATCVTGNIGQSAYSVANMFMTGLAARRRKLQLAGSAINIGAILGVGYVTRETSQELQNNLLKSGHVWMSEEDFHTLFAEAILAGSPSLDRTPEINSGLRIIHAGDKQRPLWSFYPKFQHLVRPEEIVASEQGLSGSRVSVVAQLATAANANDTLTVLASAFIGKLFTILQLDESISQGTVADMTAEDLGIDSLNAVEIRSWTFKELHVDIPVLRILGGAKVSDLLLFILDKVPSELVPLIGSGNRAIDFNLSEAQAVNQTTAIAEHSPRQASGLIVDTFDDALLLDPESMEYENEGEAAQSSSPPQASSEFSFENLLEDSSTNGSSAVFIPTPAVTDFELEPVPSIEGDYSTDPRPSPVVERSQAMSYSQSNFWFLKSFVQDPATFNISVALEVTGQLEISRLSQAVGIVGARHEALRTSYLLDKDQHPIQAILAHATLHLAIESFSDEIERQLVINSVKTHEYDLQQGDVMRIVLLLPTASCEDRSSYLVFGYPHINMDGISFQILLDDLRKAYVGGSLDTPALQFPDYASRQYRQHKGGEWADDLTYWRREFATLPPLLPLLLVGNVRQRKALAVYDHHKCEYRVGAQLASKIRAVCKSAKITPYHFFLATFQVMVGRLSQSSDLCIGVADSGRVEHDSLTSIGLYLNILPLRMQFQQDQSFQDAAQDVRRQTYKAMAHSRPPIHVLLSELNVPRSATHSPLFQAFVDYRQSINETQAFGDCMLTGRDYEVGKTAYDVALDISDNDTGEALIVLALQSALYSPEAGASLMRSYTKLLTVFAENASAVVGKVDLHWNEDIEVALSAGRGEDMKSQWQMTLPEQVEKMAQTYPNSLAIKDGSGTSLTYRSMMRRVYQLVTTLVETGLAEGSPVGVFQDANNDWICSMLAIMRSGLIYVPLDLKVGIQRLAEVVKDCKPAAILYDSTTQSQLESLHLGDTLAIDVASATRSGEYIPAKAYPDRPATILYTSGSTGKPKGAVLGHSGLRNNLEGCSSRFGISRDDYGILQISLSFDFSIWLIFMCLANGAALLVAPKSNRGDAKALTRLIATEGITFTGATPSEYISWFRHGDVSSLRDSMWRCAVSSGEQMTDVLKGQFAALQKEDLLLYNGYGPTEGSIAAASIPVDYQDERERTELFTPGGFTLPNYALFVLDNENKPLPTNFEGQICIAGAGVGMGYLNNEVLSRQKFITNPYAPMHYQIQGWKMMHLTGDRGLIRSDGSLVVRGRISGDTQIKLRGLRMDLRDIEVAIATVDQDKIQDAVVSVRKSEDEESEFLVAHIVFSSTFPLEKHDDFLRSLHKSLPLPQYMVPHVFLAIQSLPLSAHSKLDRKAIAELPLPTSAKKRVQFLDSKSNRVEQELADLWHNLLPAVVKGNNLIARTTDFFSIGGDSIMLLKLQDQIQRSFGVDLPLVQLFEASTLESMAAKISATTGFDEESHTAVSESQTVLPERQTVLPKNSKAMDSKPLFDSELISPQSSANIDWDRETALPETLTTYTARPSPAYHVVVMTGATGFLGNALVENLHRDDRVAKIHCIAVRNPQKLKDASPSDKLHVHQGDLAAPLLGLEEDTAASIFGEATAIIHNGADVNFMKQYASLRPSNVGSTRELLQLASHHNVPIHYVSTAGIAQLVGCSVLGEESVAALPPKLEAGAIGTGYAASKWVSEVLLEKTATSLALPVTIHRPTNVVTGDGSDGPATDLVDNLLKFSRKIRAVPISDVWTDSGELDFVSVDTVAVGIVASALQSGVYTPRPPTARFVHHSGEMKVALTEVKQFLERESGRQLRVVPLAVWVAEAEMAGLDSMVAEILLDAEKRGVRMRFAKLVKGLAHKKMVRRSKSQGMLGSLGRMASSVGRAVSIV